MYPLKDWPCESPKLYERPNQGLITCDYCDETLQYTELSEFIQSSENFPIKFPISTGRCKMLKNEIPELILLRNINSSYPVLHEVALPLFLDFIVHKTKFGSNVEKNFYKSMGFLQFIDRLLQKRAVMFMGKNDDYILLSGVKGRGKWEDIGTDDEEAPLTLENCLSYDEIKLSAFLSVSSYSYFVNDGSRKNKGVNAKFRNNIEEEGIIIGLIGARMKKKCYMEYQDIILDQKQNTEANGFGVTLTPTVQAVFSNFYGKSSVTYTDFLKSKDRGLAGYFKEISKGVYFDNITYSKRLAISIDTLLFEANHRAKEKKTTAFVHVVGIGLGVWKCSTHQEEVFMETFAKRVEFLGKHLQNISDIYFAYFALSSSCGKYKHGSKIPIQGHPHEGIRVFVSQRQPHQALTGDNKGKLLVVSYAWDGNSLPGNEFWSGKLASTGDSAAASSTQIAEIHNPHINRNVCARNLRIATKEGIFAYGDYVMCNRKRKREDQASTSQ